MSACVGCLHGRGRWDNAPSNGVLSSWALADVDRGRLWGTTLWVVPMDQTLCIATPAPFYKCDYEVGRGHGRRVEYGKEKSDNRRTLAYLYRAPDGLFVKLE